MKLKLIPFFFSIFVPVIFLSCAGDDPKPLHQKSAAETNEIIKKQFIRVNQQLVQKEADEMDYYAASHKLPVIKATSGIRYYVYKHSEKGDSIRSDMEITMAYNVSLLDGTPCYSSKTEGAKTFIVGREDIESGIHKGVQYLKRGDKAIFIIPSALAHGLLGDFKKIPPQMPIVYDVQVY